VEPVVPFCFGLEPEHEQQYEYEHQHQHQHVVKAGKASAFARRRYLSRS
jgi:hypothetical protein